MRGSEIIDALGGTAKVAALTGSRPGAVRNWRRDGIPAKFWLRLLDVAREREVKCVTPEAIQWRPSRDGVAA